MKPYVVVWARGEKVGDNLFRETDERMIKDELRDAIRLADAHPGAQILECTHVPKHEIEIERECIERECMEADARRQKIRTLIDQRRQLDRQIAESSARDLVLLSDEDRGALRQLGFDV